MKVFAFDLLPYAEHLDHLKEGKELPWPLPYPASVRASGTWTLADLERNHGLLWGRPEEVRDKLMAEAEAVGANTVLLNFNRGAMPHVMFVEQLRRFGAEILPALQAHQITQVPV